MGAKLMLAAMLLGTPTVMVLGARSETAAPPPSTPPRYTERPWLSREASAELIGAGAHPGPLFAGVILGGSEPPAPIRERIAGFAKQHGVDIDLEMEHGNVAGIRVTVVYDGGFGYEGADVLGLRLERPTTGGGCFGPSTWINNWSQIIGDGVYMRVSIRVNRVDIFWGPTRSLADLLHEAEAMLGARANDRRRSLGDRWRQLGDSDARIELPLGLEGFATGYELGGLNRTYVSIRDGRVADVSFELDDDSGETVEDQQRALRKRWGRPSVKRIGEDSWFMWRRPTFIALGDEGNMSLMTPEQYATWERERER